MLGGIGIAMGTVLGGKGGEGSRMTYNIMNLQEYITAVESKRITFPYTRDIYTDEHIRGMFSKLQAYDYVKEKRIIVKPYTIRNLPRLSKKYLQYMGKPLILQSKDEDYENYNTLSDMFNESCRMECKLYFQTQSAHEYFRSSYKVVGEYCLKKYKVINNLTLRDSIYELHKQCTTFRPNVMLTAIQMFKPKTILDFSSGWGDRLVAFLASTAEKYVGVDPNECLHPNYDRMIAFFKPQYSKYKKEVHMVKGQFEKVNINAKFDMVMTSPPYFVLEKYTSQPTQSISNYPEQKQWYDNFLIPSLTKCIECLNKGGHLVLNISQRTEGDTYTYDMLQDLEKVRSLKYLGTLVYNSNNPQPVFMWEKL
jgi:tRNA1(Val) A37 N6-methylase TrmN6